MLGPSAAASSSGRASDVAEGGAERERHEATGRQRIHATTGAKESAAFHSHRGTVACASMHNSSKRHGMHDHARRTPGTPHHKCTGRDRRTAGWPQERQCTGMRTMARRQRDKPRDQALIEATGKRIARVFMGRCPGADVYHRRWDDLVLVDGQPIVRLVLAADGPPSVLWNPAALIKRNLDKDDLQELARAAPPSAASVAWTA